MVTFIGSDASFVSRDFTTLIGCLVKANSGYHHLIVTLLLINYVFVHTASLVEATDNVVYTLRV